MTDLEKGLEAYNKGDYITAFHILEPFAKRNDLEVMLIFGSMFETGQQGIPQNYSETFKWFQRSAQGNDARGLFNYGRMYYEGVHVPKDYREARKLFIQATEKGHAEAYYYLGMIYQEGHVQVNGKQVDYITAHMSFNLGASKGCEKSLEKRDDLEKKMLPEQIEKAQDMALGVWEKENPKPQANP